MYKKEELKKMGIESFTGFYSTAIENLEQIKKEIIQLYKKSNKDVKDFDIYVGQNGDVSFSVWKEDNRFFATASLKRTIAFGDGKVITEAITNMFVNYYGYNFQGDFNHLQKVLDSCNYWALKHSDFYNSQWDG